MSLRENKCLLLPGPVFIPPRVLQAMGRQMINRRGPEFQALLVDVTENLKTIFQTRGDVLLFPGSGTAGLEIAVVNVLSPGDRVLSLAAGVFSERFARIAETVGMKVQKLRFPLEEGVEPYKLSQELKADRGKKIKAVLLTHNETSSGVTNDLESIGEIVHEHGSLLLVDAVSSLGGVALKTDKWHCDVVVGTSQKALFASPGIVIVSVSEKAWHAIDQSQTPSYFFDLRLARKAYDEKRLTPYTAPTTILYGLQEALNIIREEGFINVLDRYRLLTKALRNGIKAIGLEPFVGDDRASQTVTTVRTPPSIDSAAVRKTMRETYHVYIAGGLGEMEKTTFRIGHLGYVGRGDILNGISALELALAENGYQTDIGQGVAAVQKTFG